MNIKKTIIVEIVAEDEQIIKDMFKVLSDQLFQNYQLLGYKIMYKEEDEEVTNGIPTDK